MWKRREEVGGQNQGEDGEKAWLAVLFHGQHLREKPGVRIGFEKRMGDKDVQRHVSPSLLWSRMQPVDTSAAESLHHQSV